VSLDADSGVAWMANVDLCCKRIFDARCRGHQMLTVAQSGDEVNSLRETCKFAVLTFFSSNLRCQQLLQGCIKLMVQLFIALVVIMFMSLF